MSLRSLALAATSGDSPATIESLAQEFLDRYQSQVKLAEADFESHDKRAWFAFVLQNLSCDPILWSDNCQRLALLSFKIIIRTGTDLAPLCTKEVFLKYNCACSLTLFQSPAMQLNDHAVQHALLFWFQSQALRLLLTIIEGSVCTVANPQF